MFRESHLSGTNRPSVFGTRPPMTLGLPSAYHQYTYAKYQKDYSPLDALDQLRLRAAGQLACTG